MKGPFLNKALWSAAASIATTVGSLLCGIIVARYLGPAATGTVSYLLWTCSILSLMFGLGLTHSATRFVAEFHGNTGNLANAIGVSMARWSTLGLIPALGVFGLIAWHGARTGSPAQWLICAGYLFLQQLNAVYLSIYLGFQRFARIASINVLGACLQVAGTLLLIRPWGVTGSLFGQCLGVLPGAFLGLQIVFTRGVSRLDSAIAHRIWRYTAPAWIADILSSLAWSRTEVFFIELNRGASAVAFFTVGLTLANIATQLPQMMMNALFPHFSSLAGGDVRILALKAGSALRLAGLTLIPASLLLALGASVWIPLVFGARFTGAVLPAYGLIVCAALALFTPAVQYAYARGSSGVIAAQNIMSGIVGVLGCWTLVPKFGVEGAVASRMLAQSVGIVCMAFLLKRRFGLELPFGYLGRVAFNSLVAGLPIVAVLYFRGPVLFPLIVATIAGGGVYIILLRFSRLVFAGDVKPIQAWNERLPEYWRRYAIAIVRWLSPPSPAVATDL